VACSLLLVISLAFLVVLGVKTITLVSAQTTTMTVSDLKQEGLVLSPIQNTEQPEFVLTNNTPKSVIAVGVRWSFRMPSQDLVQQHDRLYLNHDLKSLIGAHEKTPPISFKHIGMHKIRNGATAIGIALDLVIFEDGFSLGADNAQSRDNIRAKLDVTRDLAATVIAMQRERTDTEMSDWIENLRKSSYSDRPIPQRVEFSRPRYREWYFFYQDEAAMVIAGVGKNLGWAEAVNRSEQVMRKPPIVIR
jgi:hypothetical protein